MPLALRLGALVLALASPLGCEQSRVEKTPRGNQGGSGGAGVNLPPGPGGTGGAGPNVALPDGGGEAAAPSPPQACAEETLKAERVPVDLLLLVDASSSMSTPGAGTTISKYALVKQALLAFSRDPGSAGLGLGLQFFPQPGGGWPCTSDADCGGRTNSAVPACQPVSACRQALAMGTYRSCGVGRAC